MSSSWLTENWRAEPAPAATVPVVAGWVEVAAVWVVAGAGAVAGGPGGAGTWAVVAGCCV
jgi:hypothetical protein